MSPKSINGPIATASHNVLPLPALCKQSYHFYMCVLETPTVAWLLKSIFKPSYKHLVTLKDIRAAHLCGFGPRHVNFKRNYLNALYAYI